MALRQFIGPLRNPKVVATIVFGSAALSALLTVADPTPLRRSLGLEKDPAGAAAPAPPMANQAPLMCPTNGTSAAIASKSQDKTPVEATSQMLTMTKQ